MAADVHDVAEALGRQHPGLGAAVLEDRVRRDGRSVEDGVDVGGRDLRMVAELKQARDQSRGPDRQGSNGPCGRAPPLESVS